MHRSRGRGLPLRLIHMRLDGPRTDARLGSLVGRALVSSFRQIHGLDRPAQNGFPTRLQRPFCPFSPGQASNTPFGTLIKFTLCSTFFAKLGNKAPSTGYITENAKHIRHENVRSRSSSQPRPLRCRICLLPNHRHHRSRRICVGKRACQFGRHVGCSSKSDCRVQRRNSVV